MLILFDSERVQLSRLLTVGYLSTLPHPLLHYVSIGAALLGLLLAGTGILGCWAACMNSYCMLTFYLLIIVIALVGECAIYIVAWLWPNCMGLGPDTEDLVKALQRNYGVSGQEHFTVAVDLAQTMFKCCGIDSANEYDTSLWRLQGLGPRLAVPLTCCKLLNGNDTKAYLSPRPINQNFCQDLEKQTHSAYRHTVGCWMALDQWYREHYFAFLMVGFVIVLVEFSVLMSTILSCTRIYHYNQELKEASRQIERDPPEPAFIPVSRASSSQAGAYSNDTYALTDQFNKHQGDQYKHPEQFNKQGAYANLVERA
nr:unnamed protein product [Callosobruchus chinensis]